jgi:hypothetical protein
MTIFINKSKTKSIRVRQELPGFVTATIIEKTKNTEKVLFHKYFSNIKQAQKWAEKTLN